MDGLTGLAAHVTAEAVHALLLNRVPRILDPQRMEYALLGEHLQRVANEVALVVGDPEPDTPVHRVAVDAVSLGAAANIERALFPEQQLGDISRARDLYAQYRRTLDDLRALGPTGSPIGTFPPAPCDDAVAGTFLGGRCAPGGTYDGRSWLC